MIFCKEDRGQWLRQSVEIQQFNSRYVLLLCQKKYWLSTHAHDHKYTCSLTLLSSLAGP